MPSGQEIELIEFVDASDHGPRTSIWGVLEDAWQLEFTANNPNADQTPESMVAAKLAGLRRDREKLEALGLDSAFKRNKRAAIPFAEWESEMVRWLRERKIDTK